MRWILIRHGKTQGNLEGRYIGCRTDEPLCAAGRKQLTSRCYPAAGSVYCSPMIRCLETAQLIYSDIAPKVLEGFQECDFGDFENLSYHQLNGRADYQAWIDSGGEAPFPGGECRAEFAHRCLMAFDTVKNEQPSSDCALIVHGGTIMAIMEKYARPKGDYFDFQVDNGDGFILYEDGNYEKIGS